MAVVLFAWELGGGMGHIMQMRPLAQGLAARGHRVFLALRDLSAAHLAFADLNVALLQAPFHHRITAPPFPRTSNYAHILANIGFADDATLRALTAAWRNIYRLVRPDLIIFDHSPTALLASRGAPARTMLIGAGFFIPPDLSPFPNLLEVACKTDAELLADERPILDRVNRCLTAWNLHPIERLGQLFSQAIDRFLMTFDELDHYPQRSAAKYWGPVNASGGEAPQWPDAQGKKIYAYLKSFSALPDLLKALSEQRLPTIVVADGIEPRLLKQFSSPTLRFERRRLDPDRVARECDLAIMNGNHGTAASMLLAGRPTLQLSLTLEQGIIARRIRDLGAGLNASSRKPDEIVERLDSLLSSDDFGSAAGAIAAKYSTFDPRQQSQEMLSRCLSLL